MCPPCACADWGSSRILGDHQFIFPTFAETAFVSTYLGARVGVSYNQVSNLPFGRLGRVDVANLRIAEGIDLGIRLFDGVGIFGTLAGVASVSTNARSLVIRTGQYEVSGRGGAIVKLLQTDETLLSVRANVGGARGANFTLVALLSALTEAPIAAIEDVISDGLDEFLIVPFSRFEWGGSVALAQAFSPAFSLQASAGVLVGSTTLKPFSPLLDAREDLDFNSLTPALAVALAGDARTVGVPLALMLEWEISFPRTTNELNDRTQSLTQNTVAAGLFYSGREDLQTGVLAFAELGLGPITGFTPTGEPADSDKPRLFGGTVTLRYVW
ncbi:MAG: hypothetical protein ACOX6T_19280 [Myxococcales bacterium]|jgi:hypothetical protein